MIILWIFVIAVVVYIVFAFVRRESRDGGSGGPSSLEILKKRLAAGEISEEEFERKKKILRE